MPRPIEILEQIQKIDLEIGAVEGEEKGYRGEIEGLSEGLKRAEAELEALDAEVDQIKGALQEVEERIRAAVERIEKDEGRLNTVKAGRELKALNKEISTAGKSKRQAEREVSEIRDRLTEKGVFREAKELEAGKIRSEIERLNGEFEAKRAGWGKAVEDKINDRKSLKDALSGELVRKYDNIRSRRGGRAVVPLKKEACQGCYMHVPPQINIRLLRGEEEIITCPHCYRILYVEEEARPEVI